MLKFCDRQVVCVCAVVNVCETVCAGVDWFIITLCYVCFLMIVHV